MMDAQPLIELVKKDADAARDQLRPYRAAYLDRIHITLEHLARENDELKNKLWTVERAGHTHDPYEDGEDG